MCELHEIGTCPGSFRIIIVVVVQYNHTYTSDFSENCRCEIASGAIHLSGSLLAFLLDWYISSASRDRPKSVTFSSLLQLTRTFLQAKSRWMTLRLDKYSCEREKVMTFFETMR